MTPAKLYDYERLAVRGAYFPAVIKPAAVYMWEPMTEVDGLHVFNLTDSQRKELDDYEGELYNLMPVMVWVEVVGELVAREEGSTKKRRHSGQGTSLLRLWRRCEASKIIWLDGYSLQFWKVTKNRMWILGHRACLNHKTESLKTVLLWY